MEYYLTLEAVQAEFQWWRQNRVSRGARTPQVLRDKARIAPNKDPKSGSCKTQLLTHLLRGQWF